MSRIRTIKPDFFTDDKVGQLSPSARLLFIGAWVFADDNGNLSRSAKQLKAQVFPYDSIDCAPLLDELIALGLVLEYGENYLHIKGFSSHQKIDRPSKSRIPLPETLDEDSTSPQRILVEHSERARRGLAPRARSGREGKGRESNKAAREYSSSPPPAGLDPAAWKRWQDYRTQTRRPLKPVSIPAAQRQLAAYGAEQAAVVEQSIANGWQGLFDQKPKQRAAAQPEPTREQRAADEKHIEERAAQQLASIRKIRDA